MKNQITKEFFQEVLDWFNANQADRTFTVTNDSNGNINVWFYDYRLQYGKHSMSAIPDLELMKNEEDMKKFMELQSKFGTKGDAK